MGVNSPYTSDDCSLYAADASAFDAYGPWYLLLPWSVTIVNQVPRRLSKYAPRQASSLTVRLWQFCERVASRRFAIRLSPLSRLMWSMSVLGQYPWDIAHAARWARMFVSQTIAFVYPLTNRVNAGSPAYLAFHVRDSASGVFRPRPVALAVNIHGGRGFQENSPLSGLYDSIIRKTVGHVGSFLCMGAIMRYATLKRKGYAT